MWEWEELFLSMCLSISLIAGSSLYGFSSPTSTVFSVLSTLLLRNFGMSCYLCPLFISNSQLRHYHFNDPLEVVSLLAIFQLHRLFIHFSHTHSSISTHVLPFHREPLCFNPVVFQKFIIWIVKIKRNYSPLQMMVLLWNGNWHIKSDVAPHYWDILIFSDLHGTLSVKMYLHTNTFT